MPSAEVRIDRALVERLLHAQMPELVGPVRIVANGWDNVLARIGDDLVARLPRRAASAGLIEHEVRWLGALAPRLPVVIPVPIAVGEPGERYPWTWTVARWIEGRPLTALDPGTMRRVAIDLASTHRALHAQAAPGAPRNPVRGVPLAARADVVRARIARLQHADAAVLDAAFRDGLAAPPATGPDTWLHGDPHPGNVLVTHGPEPRLAALIDFGDLGAGDPATDLAIAWTGLDAAARAVYRDALAPDPSAWRRGRAWAAVIASAMALELREHPEHAPIVRRTLDGLRTG